MWVSLARLEYFSEVQWKDQSWGKTSRRAAIRSRHAKCLDAIPTILKILSLLKSLLIRRWCPALLCKNWGFVSLCAITIYIVNIVWCWYIDYTLSMRRILISPVNGSSEPVFQSIRASSSRWPLATLPWKSLPSLHVFSDCIFLSILAVIKIFVIRQNGCRQRAAKAASISEWVQN